MLAGASHPGSVVTSQSTPTITTPGHRRSRRARGGAGCQAAALTATGCCSGGRGASGTREVVSLMQSSSRNEFSEPTRKDQNNRSDHPIQDGGQNHYVIVANLQPIRD